LKWNVKLPVIIEKHSTWKLKKNISTKNSCFNVYCSSYDILCAVGLEMFLVRPNVSYYKK
jgi:hypothetical protein